MFLMSEAFRAMTDPGQRPWDWSRTSILLVSHQWNPTRHGAEALAGRRLVDCLLDAGARVHVLASGCAEQELQHPRYAVSVVPDRAGPHSRAGLALQMVRSTIPESAGQWVPGAVEAGRRILASLPADTIIYGRASPGSSNVAAWRLAALTGRPFVAHFSDEWPCFQLRSNRRTWMAPYKWPLFKLWRNRILRDTGALTFTNPAEACKMLAGEVAEHRHKSFVVTHLPGARGAAGPPQYDVFHLVHTGNFYPPGHTAAPLLQGIRLFLDQHPDARRVFRLTNAGWSHGDLPAWTTRCGLDDVVRVVGRLSQGEVLALIDSATLLLAIDFARPHSTSVLSKLPDYLHAERPILAITAPSSSMARLFSDDGAGQTAHYESPDEIAARITTVFAAWRQRRLDALLPRRAARASFSSERVLSELGAAFSTARGERVDARAVGRR